MKELLQVPQLAFLAGLLTGVVITGLFVFLTYLGMYIVRPDLYVSPLKIWPMKKTG